MKTLLFALLLPTANPAAIAAQTVRVLTYNIHHGEGSDLKIDLERIAEVILSADPGLVALQEVDVRTSRVSGADQARELARLTGMHVVFGRTIPYRGGLYGNALLSKWPVNRFVNHALPFTAGREPRGVIEALILAPPGEEGGADFQMFATHLDISEADRLLAVGQLQRLLADRPPDWPMLIAGDMNATPGSTVVNLLAKDWTPASSSEPLHTFPAAKPSRQIDFIFFRPATRWKVIETKVLDENVASDHRPLLAVLELLPASEPARPRTVEPH